MDKMGGVAVKTEDKRIRGLMGLEIGVLQKKIDFNLLVGVILSVLCGFLDSYPVSESDVGCNAQKGDIYPHRLWIKM